MESRILDWCPSPPDSSPRSSPEPPPILSPDLPPLSPDLTPYLSPRLSPEPSPRFSPELSPLSRGLTLESLSDQSFHTYFGDAGYNGRTSSVSSSMNMSPSRIASIVASQNDDTPCPSRVTPENDDTSCPKWLTTSSNSGTITSAFDEEDGPSTYATPLASPTLLATNLKDLDTKHISSRMKNAHDSIRKSILPFLAPELHLSLEKMLKVVDKGLEDTICEVQEHKLEEVLTSNMSTCEESQTLEGAVLQTLTHNLQEIVVSLDYIGGCILKAAAMLDLPNGGRRNSLDSLLHSEMDMSTERTLDDIWLDTFADHMPSTLENIAFLESIQQSVKKKTLKHEAALIFRKNREAQELEKQEKRKAIVPPPRYRVGDHCPSCGMEQATRDVRKSFNELSARQIVQRGVSPTRRTEEERHPGEPKTPETHGYQKYGSEKHGFFENFEFSIIAELQTRLHSCARQNTLQEAELVRLRSKCEETEAQLRKVRKGWHWIPFWLARWIRPRRNDMATQTDITGGLMREWDNAPGQVEYNILDSSSSYEASLPTSTFRSLAEELEDAERCCDCGCSEFTFSSEMGHWKHVFDVSITYIASLLHKIGMVVHADAQRRSVHLKKLHSFSFLCVFIHCQILLNFVITMALTRERDMWLQSNGLTRIYLIDYLQQDPSSMFLPGVDLRLLWVWDASLTKHVRRTIPQHMRVLVALLVWMWKPCVQASIHVLRRIASDVERLLGQTFGRDDVQQLWRKFTLARA